MSDFVFAPTSLNDPKLVQMVKDYYDAYHIDQGTFRNPGQWVGVFRDDELLAAIGFTRSPDSSIVFVGELVCEKSMRGRRAIKRLAENFQTYCLNHPDIQMVVGQCLVANKAMHDFFSRSTFMRPVSTVFACAKSDLAKENESGRWVRL